jgi:hypothetical protein
MNRKMFGLVAVGIALMALGATSAHADSLTFNSMTAIPTPFSGTPYNITALGNLDWIMPGVDEKADTSIIPDPSGVAAQADGPGDYPAFTYTNGKWNAGTQTATAKYNYPTPYAQLSMPAGSGQIMLWCGDGGSAPFTPSTVNAWLDGDYPASLVTRTLSNNSRQLAVFDYNLSAPRGIWLSSDPNGAVNAGWFAVAVSSIPEPSCIVLTSTGVLGLLAYAWRKRK